MINLSKIATALSRDEVREIIGIDLKRVTYPGADGISRTFWEETVITDKSHTGDSSESAEIWIPKRWNNFQFAFLAVLQAQPYAALIKNDLDCYDNIRRAIAFARANCFDKNNPKKPIHLALAKGFKSYNQFLNVVKEDYEALCMSLDRFKATHNQITT